MTGPLGDDLGVAIPDVPEPIRAYRMWSLDTNGLKSFRGTRWPTDTPLDAACLLIEHEVCDVTDMRSPWDADLATTSVRRCTEVPSPTDANHDGHGCGIYAYSNVIDMLVDQGTGGDTIVFGEVLLWGRVYEHEKGYRAEHARIAALWRPLPDAPAPAIWLLDALAALYDIDVIDPPVTSDDITAAMEERQRRHRAMWNGLHGWSSGGAMTAAFTGGTFTVTVSAPEVKRRPSVAWWAISTFSCAGVAWCATFAGIYALTGRWGWAAFHAALCAVNVNNARFMWRKRHV